MTTVENGFNLISKKEYRAIERKWYGATDSFAEYSRYAGVTAIAVLLVVLWPAHMESYPEEEWSVAGLQS